MESRRHRNAKSQGILPLASQLKGFACLSLHPCRVQVPMVPEAYWLRLVTLGTEARNLSTDFWDRKLSWRRTPQASRFCRDPIGDLRLQRLELVFDFDAHRFFALSPSIFD